VIVVGCRCLGEYGRRRWLLRHVHADPGGRSWGEVDRCRLDVRPARDASTYGLDQLVAEQRPGVGDGELVAAQGGGVVAQRVRHDAFPRDVRRQLRRFGRADREPQVVDQYRGDVLSGHVRNPDTRGVVYLFPGLGKAIAGGEN
jgi:hypothetical protein